MENTREGASGGGVCLFLSDTHLFHKRNMALQIHGAMIEQSDADEIYLLGDIIDYEYLQELLEHSVSGALPDTFEDAYNQIDMPELEAHLRFFDVLMAKIDQGAKVFYVTGNHDNNLDLLHGKTVNGIEFHDHMVREFGGVKTHLEHGDENDPAALINYSGLYAKCGKALSAGLVIDQAINKSLKTLFNAFSSDEGPSIFPTTNVMKKIGKFFIGTFRENAVHRARERGAEATVLGHIHKQDIAHMNEIHDISNDNQGGLPTILVENDGFIYRNTGDGLTHGTALAYDGKDDAYSHQGWHVLTRGSVDHTATFVADSENPYREKYRAKTMAFLEEGWKTFLATADPENGWDHAGKKVQDIRRGIPAQSADVIAFPARSAPKTSVPDDALYPHNGF